MPDILGHSIPDDFYGVNPDIAQAYIETLVLHIESVQKAASLMGLPSHVTMNHDASKFLPEEFIGYALHFKGGGAPDLFSRAWLHHIHHNPHHWQHWLFPDGYSPKGSEVENGCVEMPVFYAYEMIADWMGASYAYTGSWDMAEWLSENTPRIKVHSKTAQYLYRVLNGMGYGDFVQFPSL